MGILDMPLFPPVARSVYIPCGEYTRRFMGMLDMPLFPPVARSVSSSISFRTMSKSVNIRPLQCKNSAYSVKENII